MLIYLDICCFNRPFDDQTQLRVRLESEAKLFIQDQIRSGNLQLAWSYMMDFENSANPFAERRRNTTDWKQFTGKDIEATPHIIESAHRYLSLGFKKKDLLHIACAIAAQCTLFFTTDKGILKRKHLVHEIAIFNPIDYITHHDD